MNAGEYFRREVKLLTQQRKCSWSEAWALQKQMSPILYGEMESGLAAPSSMNATNSGSLKLGNIRGGESSK